MDIGALPQLLIALFRNPAAQVPQADKAGDAASQFKPGQQYEGQVREALPNGRHLVQVGGQALDMALPGQTRAGDVIRLTYLGPSPRLTFVMTPSPGAQAVSLSQAAQQISALVRYVPVSSSPPASAANARAAPQQGAAVQPATAQAATLSAAATATARPILSNPAVLLAPAPATAGPLTATPGPAIPGLALTGEAVEGTRAPLASNTSLTAQGAVSQSSPGSHLLPMRLQQTVKESGLFYESHLGRWVKGELSLESVQREPQARLLQTPGPLLNIPDLDGMPEEAARLASRQLHLLEGGPFVWQGQAWPGQNLEWLLREGGEGEEGEEYEGQKWSSTLNLHLPRLGDIGASLDIGAQGLRIRLRASTPETLAEMQAGLPELATRLRAADLNLTSLAVEAGDGQA